MEIPIDKIKVNNAVIVFCIIITCLFCPLTLLLVVDYKIFFDYDLIKTLIAVFSVGCTQFGIIYVGNSLSMRIQNYTDDGPIEPTMVTYLLQHPLVNTSVLLMLSYGILIIICHVLNFDIKDAVDTLVYCNFGIVFGSVLDFVFFSVKAKKKRKQANASLPH